MKLPTEGRDACTLRSARAVWECLRLECSRCGECTSLRARGARYKVFSRAGWKSVKLRDVADWSVSSWRKRWTLPAWLYRGPGTVGAHFPCHWPLQRQNRSNVVQRLPPRGRLHHIFEKSMEIVYATQKGVQLLRFELHEMAGRHFLCLINIHKVAEETNSRTF